MATPRFPGGSVSTRSPPTAIVPAVTSSRPAIILSSVDFPQPEGPRKTTNSPASMDRETSSSTVSAP